MKKIEDEQTKKSEESKKNNKKVIIIIIIVIAILILCILVFSKKEDKTGIIFEQDDALSLGEKKYLSFLWMVDGAFNNQRYNEEFVVNGKKIKDVNKKFTCTYEEDSKMCIGNNFEGEFKNLFASKINYNKVYGDGQSFYWYQKIDDTYQFTNMNTCNIGRMSVDQKIEVKEEEKDKISYIVTFNDSISSGIYKGDRSYTRNFVLIKEDGDWKVSEAYYHDPCYMDYYIE